MANTQEDREELLRIWEKIKEQVEGLKYGSVNIIVHDGRITQVETNSKLRF
jgi:hypothetical protein